MKKLFVFLLLVAATVNAKAALFINNNTACEAVLVLYAHDVNNPGACAYYSTRLQVPGGTSFAYNNVTSANFPNLGWYLSSGGGAATLVTTSSGWDGVRVYYNGWGDIGNPGTCATGTTYTATYGGCTITATWMVIGSNVFVDIN